jgi:dTMP kinase
MGKRDLDRFEMAGDDFHARVDQGFAAMAADDPERWIVVDASGSHEDVTAFIRGAVRERLGV